MVEIRPCSSTQILAETDLIQEYSAECKLIGLPDPMPRLELYRIIEQAGALQCFGAYHHNCLIGFVTVLVSVIPHYGSSVAVTESLFVAAKHRPKGAGAKLIRQAEHIAKDCVVAGLLISAPLGSVLADVLPNMDYTLTNLVFFKGFKYE